MKTNSNFRKKTKIIPVFIFVLLIVNIPILIGNTIIYNMTDGKSKSDPKIALPSASITHGTINFNSNSDVDSFPNKTGSGTKADPYVIENLEIRSTDENLVKIENVSDRHIIFRNCDFEQDSELGSNPRLFYILNSGNITIDNCRFHDSSSNTVYYILEIINSDDCQVINCEFEDITSTSVIYVIRISAASKITILNTTISNVVTINQINAIEVVFSDYITIDRVNIDEIDGGNIYLINSLSTDDSLYQNIVANGLKAASDMICFEAHTGSNITLRNCIFNDVTGRDVFGFIIRYVQYSRFENNSISELYTNVRYYGFSGEDMDGCTITKNSFTDLRKFPNLFSYDMVIFSDSTKNTIFYNIFACGRESASDSSGDNTWAQPTFFEPTGEFRLVGNYYANYTGADADGDLIGDIPYVLYSAIDNAPIKYGAFDVDRDGLFNFEEFREGTDINNKDTDGDGLSDYDEVKITGTNPLSNDTDGDGILDGEDSQPLLVNQTILDGEDSQPLVSQTFFTNTMIAALIIGGSMVFFGSSIFNYSRILKKRFDSENKGNIPKTRKNKKRNDK